MITDRRHAQTREAQVARDWPTVPDDVFVALGVSRSELKDDFDRQLRGRIVLQGMPNYEEACSANPAYPSTPLMIVYCKAFADVRRCLFWARRKDWSVVCRSGGHSTAGFSLNNGVVIDVSGIDYVVVDPALKQARVGAGATFGLLDTVLDMYRLHVPGGGCPAVGVAGFMQGGGYGFTSREFGMNSDSVMEATIMLADGSIVVANCMQNRDLYWAIRGGTGNNFGVLLEIRYQLYDLHTVWGFCLIWPKRDAPAVLLELQDRYMKTGASRRLGYLAVLATIGDQPVLAMIGMYHGGRQDGLKALASLRRIGSPQLTEQIGSYADQNLHLTDVLNAPPPPDPANPTFEIKTCGYISNPLSLADWQRIVEYFANTTLNPLNIAVIEPYGGAINTYPVGASAFIHRGVAMDFFVDSFWQRTWRYNDEAQAREWLGRFAQALDPYFNGLAYQNYPRPNFPNYRWAYWGDAFNSLLFVKQKYDGGSFFNFEQGISPYPPGDGITRSTVPSVFTDMEITYEPY